MSFDQYSETPASNYITGYFLTGMAPSSVKVAGSDIMADLASRFAAMHTSGGSSTAYTVTQTRQFSSLVNGLELIWLPNATNTGAATLAPDGLTAKNIFANGAAVIAGQIVQNVPAYCKYDGTQWNLLNPQRSTGSFTATVSGMTSTTTGTVNFLISADGGMAYWQTRAAIQGTSNSTSCSVTGIPSYLVPATSSSSAHRPIGVATSGGTNASSCIDIGTGVIFYAFGNGSNFSSSGSKGLPSFEMSYGLN